MSTPYDDDAANLRSALRALSNPSSAPVAALDLKRLGFLAYFACDPSTGRNADRSSVVLLLQGFLAAAEEQHDMDTANAIRRAIDRFPEPDIINARERP